MGVGGMSGPGSVGVATMHHDRSMRFRPMKGRMASKVGMINMIPNMPGGIPRRGNIVGVDLQDFNQKMNPHTDLKTSNLTNLQQNNRKNNTVNGVNRRDSNSTVSTGYFSMQSPNSRRASDLSQTSCLGAGGNVIPPASPYEPHLMGGNSSRRSSENSNYTTGSSFAPHPMFRNQNGLRTGCGTGNELYNASNLVVQVIFIIRWGKTQFKLF